MRGPCSERLSAAQACRDVDDVRREAAPGVPGLGLHALADRLIERGALDFRDVAGHLAGRHGSVQRRRRATEPVEVRLLEAQASFAALPLLARFFCFLMLAGDSFSPMSNTKSLLCGSRFSSARKSLRTDSVRGRPFFCRNESGTFIPFNTAQEDLVPP